MSCLTVLKSKYYLTTSFSVVNLAGVVPLSLLCFELFSDMSNDASEDSGRFRLSDNDCVFEFLSNWTRAVSADPLASWSFSSPKTSSRSESSSSTFDARERKGNVRLLGKNSETDPFGWLVTKGEKSAGDSHVNDIFFVKRNGEWPSDSIELFKKSSLIWVFVWLLN